MSEAANPARVLIVDDDAALLDALSETIALRMRSVRTDVCDDAIAALDRVRTNDYDAIITDIKMPGMDGLELLGKIGEMAPAVPVLLITGHGDTDLAVRALRGGAYDLIQKPLDRDYLLAALTRSIEASQLRREVEAKRQALQTHADELEERVRQRTEALTQANRAKDEFLGLVSHELRTPVTVILGNADVLQKRFDKLPQTARQGAIADLRHEAQRLQRIIENLLMLSRLAIGQALDSEPILIGRLVGDLVRDHKQSFPSRPLVADLPTPGPIVAASETHIELVLNNLLSNAEKYSPEGEPIEITIRESETSVEVSVLDRGPGISEDEAGLIFMPFYRSPRHSATVRGIGIGLAVCRRLVEAQKGKIWARPREGGGSDFSFTIPLWTVRVEGLASPVSSEGVAV